MPYRNPREFCRKVLGLLTVGRSVASLSADLGVSDQPIYNWRPSGPNRPRSRTPVPRRWSRRNCGPSVARSSSWKPN